MMRYVMCAVIAGWLLAGCSTAGPDLVLTDAQQCTRGGGWWRANLGLCEIMGTRSQ